MKKTAVIALLFLISLAFHSIAQESLKALRSSVYERINGKDYYIHTIKKDQSLYMISKIYGVDVSEIILENPEVKEGIRPDQKIRILSHVPLEQPKKTVKPVVEEAKNSEPEPQQPPPPPPPPPPLVIELPCGQDNSKKKEVYDVALMLPLYLDEVNRMDVENLPDDIEATYRPLMFIQFYEGFRLALDSLQQTGLSLRLYVFDVTKDTVKTKQLLTRPEMKKMDIIIGLLYHINFQIVADFAQKNNIPIVNPISERDQIIIGNPFVFKANPSQKGQSVHLADFIAKNYPGSKSIIIMDGQYPDRDAAEELLKKLRDKNLDAMILANYGEITQVCDKEKENLVMVYTVNKVYAIELITKLNENRNNAKMTLVGLPRWDMLDGLEAEYLCNLKAHMFAPAFIDYEDPGVKKFVRKFQDTYQTDPDPLAFQGFDIALYFLSAIKMFGKDIERCIPEFRMNVLHSGYEFIRSQGNGFENEHWEIFYFENFQLQRVN